MNKVTLALVAVAVAIAAVASRGAQRGKVSSAEARSTGRAITPPASRPHANIDRGMVRHTPFDGDPKMAVKVPFNGDPGMVRRPE